jgi:hypothetical protein
MLVACLIALLPFPDAEVDTKDDDGSGDEKMNRRKPTTRTPARTSVIGFVRRSERDELRILLIATYATETTYGHG